MGQEAGQRRANAVAAFADVTQARAGELGKGARRSANFGELGMPLSHQTQ